MEYLYAGTVAVFVIAVVMCGVTIGVAAGEAIVKKISKENHVN